MRRAPAAVEEGAAGARSLVGTAQMPNSPSLAPSRNARHSSFENGITPPERLFESRTNQALTPRSPIAHAHRQRCPAALPCPPKETRDSPFVPRLEPHHPVEHGYPPVPTVPSRHRLDAGPDPRRRRAQHGAGPVVPQACVPPRRTGRQDSSSESHLITRSASGSRMDGTPDTVGEVDITGHPGGRTVRVGPATRRDPVSRLAPSGTHTGSWR